MGCDATLLRALGELLQHVLFSAFKLLTYLWHGCRLLLLITRGYAVVLPRLRLLGHKRLWHVEALLRLLLHRLLVHRSGEATDMGHLRLLPRLLREGLRVARLLTVALEAVGSRCMALRTWLRHGCTIRRRRTVLSVSIPLLLPWRLHAVCTTRAMRLEAGTSANTLNTSVAECRSRRSKLCAGASQVGVPCCSARITTVEVFEVWSIEVCI